MMFLKRLFSHKKKPAAEQARGFSTQQTQGEQDATREHMEAELAADRERRGATDVRPGSEQPPAEDSGGAPTDDT
jgi:hypothetical protein